MILLPVFLLSVTLCGTHVKHVTASPLAKQTENNSVPDSNTNDQETTSFKGSQEFQPDDVYDEDIVDDGGDEVNDQKDFDQGGNNNDDGNGNDETTEPPSSNKDSESHEVEKNQNNGNSVTTTWSLMISKGSNTVGPGFEAGLKESAQGSFWAIISAMKGLFSPFITVMKTFLLPITTPLRMMMAPIRSMAQMMWTLLKTIFKFVFATWESYRNKMPTDLVKRARRAVASVDVDFTTPGGVLRSFEEFLSTMMRLIEGGPNEDIAKFLKTFMNAGWKFLRTRGLPWLHFTLDDLDKTQLLPQQIQRFIEGFDTFYELLVVLGVIGN